MSAENLTFCRAAGTNAVSVGDSVSATKMNYVSIVYVAPASPFSQPGEFFRLASKTPTTLSPGEWRFATLSGLQRRSADESLRFSHSPSRNNVGNLFTGELDLG